MPTIQGFEKQGPTAGRWCSGAWGQQPVLQKATLFQAVQSSATCRSDSRVKHFEMNSPVVNQCCPRLLNGVTC
jgi:hypothetical protein